MSPENCKIIVAMVSVTGDYLKRNNLLKPIDGHPVRNHYAHLWREIKTKFGSSYKDLDDEQFSDVLKFVNDAPNRCVQAGVK
jgi:hypothetical protein